MSEETEEEATEETKRHGFKFTTARINTIWKYARQLNIHTMKEFWEEMDAKGWGMYDILEAESPKG